MDVKLKQRLLGAVILTSLAIIVLPALFNGSEEERIRLKSSVPEPPQIAVDRLTVQDVALKIEQRARDSEARLPQGSWMKQTILISRILLLTRTISQ